MDGWMTDGRVKGCALEDSRSQPGQDKPSVRETGGRGPVRAFCPQSEPEGPGGGSFLEKTSAPL